MPHLQRTHCAMGRSVMAPLLSKFPQHPWRPNAKCTQLEGEKAIINKNLNAKRTCQHRNLPRIKIPEASIASISTYLQTSFDEPCILLYASQSQWWPMFKSSSWIINPQAMLWHRAPASRVDLVTANSGHGHGINSLPVLPYLKVL